MKDRFVKTEKKNVICILISWIETERRAQQCFGAFFSNRIYWMKRNENEDRKRGISCTNYLQRTMKNVF